MERQYSCSVRNHLGKHNNLFLYSKLPKGLSAEMEIFKMETTNHRALLRGEFMFHWLDSS